MDRNSPRGALWSWYVTFYLISLGDLKKKIVCVSDEDVLMLTTFTYHLMQDDRHLT